MNNIISNEILYVDSDSTDNSINIAQQFNVKVIKISGDVNSAVGRNVGANNSKGEILIFIDGDMEILPDFFKAIYQSESAQLKYPFINGYLIHKYYDDKYQTVLKLVTEKISNGINYRHVTGGFIIIERKYWEILGGMDERLIRNQDLDFGLRMSKINMPALLINSHVVIHHTISYFDSKRAKQFIFSRSLLAPGLLMRKHIFYKYYVKRHFLNIIMVTYLIVSSLMTILDLTMGLYLFLLYLLFNFIRVFKNYNNIISSLNEFVIKLLQSFYTFLGFFFYFPSPKKYLIKIIR